VLRRNQRPRGVFLLLTLSLLTARTLSAGQTAETWSFLFPSQSGIANPFKVRLPRRPRQSDWVFKGRRTPAHPARHGVLSARHRTEAYLCARIFWNFDSRVLRLAAALHPRPARVTNAARRALDGLLARLTSSAGLFDHTVEYWMRSLRIRRIFHPKVYDIRRQLFGFVSSCLKARAVHSDTARVPSFLTL
jgi:hypothetical protein